VKKIIILHLLANIFIYFLYKEYLIHLNIGFIIPYISIVSIKLNKILKKRQEIAIAVAPGSKIHRKAIFYTKNIKIGKRIIQKPYIYFNPDEGETRIPFLITNYKEAKGEFSKENKIRGFSLMNDFEKTEFIKWLCCKSEKPKNMGFIYIYMEGLVYRGLVEKKDLEILKEELLGFLDKNYDSKIQKYLLNTLNNILLINKEFLSGEELYQMINLYGLKYFYAVLKQEKLDNPNEYIFLKVLENLNSTLVSLDTLKEVRKIFLNTYKNIQYEKIKNEVNFKNFKFSIDAYDIPAREAMRLKNKLKNLLMEMKVYLLARKRGKPFNIAYSNLPLRSKKLITHPNAEIFENFKSTEIFKVSELKEFLSEFKDTMTLKDSVRLVDILNDNFYAVEPDAKFLEKKYNEDDYVVIYRNRNRVQPKNKEYIKLMNILIRFPGLDFLLKNNREKVDELVLKLTDEKSIIKRIHKLFLLIEGNYKFCMKKSSIIVSKRDEDILLEYLDIIPNHKKIKEKYLNDLKKDT
jgi:hypothetical protein